MLDDHTFGVQSVENLSAEKRWYQRYRPALMAAAWFWLFFFILAIVTLFSGWASLPVTLSLQIAMGFGAGALSAWLLQKENRPNPSYTRIGGLAGLTLVLTTLGAVILVALWVGIGSFGAALPLMIPYFASIPVAALICSGMGMVGARLAQWFLAYKGS